MLKKILLLLAYVSVINMYAAEESDKTQGQIEKHWMDIPAAIVGGTNIHHASQLCGRKPGFSFDVKGNWKNHYDVITTYPAAVTCDVISGFSRGLILGSFLKAGIVSYYAEEGKKFETFKDMLLRPETCLKEGVKYPAMVRIGMSNKLLPVAVVTALAAHGVSYLVDPVKKSASTSK
jgi:hypothetical protein